MRFDGVNAPDISIELALGIPTPTDPNSAGFVLGVGHLDTDQLGLTGWVDISDDVSRFTFTRGQAGEIEDAQPGQLTVYVDNFNGFYDPTNTSSPYYGLLEVGVAIWVKANWNNTSYNLFRGFVDAIDLDPGNTPTVTLDCFDGLEILARASFRTAYPDGDSTDVRVGRILDDTNWPSSLRSLDTGYSLCAATSSADAPSSALEYLNDVVSTELGMIGIDGNGVLCFYSRLHVYTATNSQTVQTTFDDLSTSNPEFTAAEVARQRSLVFTRASITRNGGTEQIYNDTTAQAKYGIRNYSGQAGVLLRNDADALSLGAWIVGRFKNPVNRISEITIDAAAQGMWSVLLDLTFLDRIRIIRTYGPPGAPVNTVDIQVVIIGMFMDVTQTDGQDYWQIKYNTRNVDVFNPFILNTSKLNTGTLA
jgi:hypothetical protein